MKYGRWLQGLRARVTLAYTVGSILLSALIATLCYSVAQNRLVSRTEQVAQAQFLTNAATVRREINAVPADADDEVWDEVYVGILERQLLRANGSIALIVDPAGEVRGNFALQDLPPQLRSSLAELRVAGLRHRTDGTDGEETRYAVGIDFSELQNRHQYYEVLRLSDLEATLSDLRRFLAGFAVLAGVAGAGLGFTAAQRALAPVVRVSNAAEAIAAGDFATRLDPMEGDPDLGQLSSSFNEMVDALEQRMERDQRFASDVSHELRSPLTTLTASVEILERRKASLPEVAQQAVNLLRDDLERFERLVEDLLEISRMDAGAVQLQLSRFNLSEFLLNVIAQSRSPEVQLNHLDRDADLIITADKRRLAQVVTNLVDNAYKYADGASGVSYRKVGDSVQIIVEDLGPGVEVDDRKTIFDRFSRTDSSAGRRSGDSGVGLGLSLVAEHTRLHGGRVWVVDRVDGREGARFVVELPIGEHTELEELAL